MTSQVNSGLLQRGHTVPFFDVLTVRNTRARYEELWQRKNLVLVCLPASDDAADAYLAELSRRSAEFDEYCAGLVITRQPVRGLPCPGVVIADRWGEIQYLAPSSGTSGLPELRELLDTLDYVQRRCPECEGESR